MPTLLIVEDEAAVRDFLSMLFEEEGYVVETARDGLAALARLAVVEPDLIISDIMMQPLTGLELEAALRNHPRYANLPVILLSAAVHPAKARLGIRTLFLPKPVELDTLLNIVAMTVDTCHAAGTEDETPLPEATGGHEDMLTREIGR